PSPLPGGEGAERGLTNQAPHTSDASREKLIALAEQGIVKMFVEFLKVDEKEIDLDVEFADYGIDSIMMMKMLNHFEEMYDQAIDPNAMLEYDTIRKLAGYMVENGILRAADVPADDVPEAIAEPEPEPEPVAVPETLEPPASRPVAVERVTVGSAAALAVSFPKPEPAPLPRVEAIPAATGPEPIAVIGLACRFPQSPSPEAYWDNLAAGRNLITEVPPEHWPMEQWFSPDKDAPGKSYSKWGAFIDDVDKFDAGLFKLTDADAVTMDPQQRILLELTRELLDRAGYRPEDIAGTRTAVLIGGGMNSYCASGFEQFNEQEMARVIVNRCTNMMAARLSDFFNLTGPSQTLDTACSSSLVAIHQACRLIRGGEADAAIVGGIDLLLDPFFHIGFSKAQVLSEDGNSYVFDERANGFVMGEGAGLVMLKPLSQARRDGDQIHGLILGSAINNDGHTMGITVPNIKGQMAVIEAALNEAGVSPETIGYLEAHGTGTLLGDPIEIKAATQVYRRHTERTGYCAVGSVKSNMGHLLRAAGVASFIKVVLSLEHGLIPPTLNCQNPHPRFRFGESPFYPVTTAQDWTVPPGERRAAISSFGFGGTNCHLILQGADTADAAAGRPALPVTPFNRQRYWKTDFGRGGGSGPKDTSSDEFYKSLLQDLRAGKVDTQEALALSRRMGARS
ncbi:beta-ketoacyl synthase N-terminal-like domain-containing protein, partial [Methylomagnum sp.]